jgi:hypothetical protein
MKTPSQCIIPTQSSHILQQIIQIIVIPAPTSPPIYHNLTLLLLLLFGHCTQQLFQLLLGDLGAQLVGSREHYQPILYVGGARFFYQADAAEAVGGVRREDLRENALALGGFLLSVVGFNRRLQA